MAADVAAEAGALLCKQRTLVDGRLPQLANVLLGRILGVPPDPGTDAHRRKFNRLDS
jgi:hypothetical protein